MKKVRELLGAHELFIEWGEPGDERELRWPGDDSIVPELHVFFVHLPK